MFYPEKMKRIRIVAHESVKEKVVKRLHELGAVQVTDYRERLSDETWGALLAAHPASPDVRRVTTQLMVINRLLDVFGMVDPERPEGFFKTLFAPAPPEKIPVEDLTGEDLFQAVEKAVASVEAEVSEPVAQLEKAEARKAELVQQRQVFERIASLDIPLEALGSGPFVSAVLGLAPRRDYAPLRSEIEALTGGTSCFFETAVSETESCLLAVCLLSDAEGVQACLRRWDVERISAGGFTGSPAAAVSDMQERLKEVEQSQQQCRQKISAAARQWRRDLKALRELMIIERERAEIYSSFAKTETVAAIEGWVTEKKSESVLKDIRQASDGLAVAQATEPDAPVEELPVSLDNPGVLKHFELLVKLYAPPQYDEIDPTVLIAPSFVFFFGLMITDAMYGVMALLLGIFILRGGGKYYPLYRSAGTLLSIGGASTILLGAMTGGWFGNLGTEYLGLEFLNSLVVLNPMVDVAPFLLFAIGVGLLHLNIGIVVGIIKDVRRNNMPGALKNVWIFFLELSLLCLYLGAKPAAFVFGVPALLFLIYSEKGMALFGVTGLLGDSLSYARLMALGLVSFGLAVAINALAKMVGGIGYVGWLLAFLVLFFGHLFSFVLNLMGAFAHGIRLHFVEFFGKFYSGGGDDFSPFRIKRDITISK